MKKIEIKTVKGLQYCLFYIRGKAPRDTGNLAENALKLESKGKGVWELYVDTNVADYMKYTNEHWDQKTIKQGTYRKGEIRTVIRTWKNPNEGWWNREIETVIQMLAKMLNGELEKI